MLLGIEIVHVSRPLAQRETLKTEGKMEFHPRPFLHYHSERVDKRTDLWLSHLCKIDVLQCGDPQLHSGVWDPLDNTRWLDLTRNRLLDCAKPELALYHSEFSRKNSSISRRTLLNHVSPLDVEMRIYVHPDSTLSTVGTSRR